MDDQKNEQGIAAALFAASRQFAQEDRVRSWKHVLITLTLLLAAAATSVSPTLPGILKAAGSVVEGLLLVRFFSFFHDHLHGALLMRSRLAGVLFRIYGLLVLAPVSVWKESHSFHHRHTHQLLGSQIGSFPVMTTSQWREASTGERFRYRLARHPLNLVFAVFTVFAFGLCLMPFFRAPRRHWEGLASVALHVLICIATVELFGPAAWLSLVGFPLALACMIGAYCFYAQHNFPGSEIQLRAGWSRARAALEASSFMKMGPLMTWFTGNIGYHHVHHLNEAIPFYRLPEAMEAIPALQHPHVISLAPRDILACLKQSLWDAESQCFVGYSE